MTTLHDFKGCLFCAFYLSKTYEVITFPYGGRHTCENKKLGFKSSCKGSIKTILCKWNQNRGKNWLPKIPNRTGVAFQKLYQKQRLNNENTKPNKSKLVLPNINICLMRTLAINFRPSPEVKWWGGG